MNAISSSEMHWTNTELRDVRIQKIANFKTNMKVTFLTGSRDSAVGIATGYGLDDSGGSVKNVLLSTSFRPAMWSTQPPIQLVSRARTPGIKQPGHEANHSHPGGAEVKKIWIYTSTTPHAFIA
jgi:hypothetical protein